MNIDKLFEDADGKRKAQRDELAERRAIVADFIIEVMWDNLGPLARSLVRVEETDPEISYRRQGDTVPGSVFIHVMFTDWEHQIGRLTVYAQDIHGEPKSFLNHETDEWEKPEIRLDAIRIHKFGLNDRGLSTGSNTSVPITADWNPIDPDPDLIFYLKRVRTVYADKLAALEEKVDRIEEKKEAERKKEIKKWVLKLAWEHRTHAESEAQADHALACLEELADGREIDIETYRYMRERWQLDSDAYHEARTAAEERKADYVRAYVAYLERHAKAHAINSQIAEQLQIDFDVDFSLYKLIYSQIASGMDGLEVVTTAVHVSTAVPDAEGFYNVIGFYGDVTRKKFFNTVSLEGPIKRKNSDGGYCETFIDEDANIWNFNEIVIHAVTEEIANVVKIYRGGMNTWPQPPDAQKYGVKTHRENASEMSEAQKLMRESFMEYERDHNPDYCESDYFGDPPF